MTDWLPFVVSGLVTGSVYSIAAMGLVVTYRTTGLFNFAHGAIGMAGAFAFYQVREEWGLPTPVAFVFAVLVFAPVLGTVVDRVLFRRMDQAAQATKIVVTMGLLILLQGLAVAIYGATPRPVEPFLPTSTFDLLDVTIGWDQVIIVALGFLILAALAGWFRYARTGVAMRAVVDDPRLAQAAGFSTTRLGALTWSLGAALATVSGVLFSPLLGLDSILLTLLVVQAYAAAVFGRLTSLPRTAVGALALGLAGSLSLKLFSGRPEFLNGLRPSLPFLFLFGALVFARRGSLRELGASVPWTGIASAGAGDWRPLAIVLVPMALLLSESRTFVLGFALVIACAFLSITVLTGTSGLISLTQAGFVGAGAFTYIHVTGAGAPFLVALVVAGLAVVPLGLAIAVPALRLPGLFLALATFGFGQLLDGLLFSTWSSFSGGGDGLRGSRPSVLQTDRAFVVFVIVVLLVLVVGIGRLRRSTLGRTLVALRDSPAAADALGIDPLWPRVSIFAISAFIAGVSGGLYAGLLQAASRTFFSTFTSLLWLTIVVVGGIQSVYGAVVGALLFYFVPDVLSGSGSPSVWLTPIFGTAAVLLARRPGGLVSLIARRVPRRIVAVRPVGSLAPHRPLTATEEAESV